MSLQFEYTASPRWKMRIPPYLKTPLLLNLLVNLSLALVALVAYFQLPPAIPLFYSLAQPTQHLAGSEWIFLFPAISSLITIIHVGLLQYFREYPQLILELFAWVTFIMQLLFALSMIRILYILS